MSRLAWAVLAFGGFYAAFWLTAFVGGYLAARRGVSEVVFLATIERYEGQLERTCALWGYEVGRRGPGGFAGMGGGAGI